MKKTIQAPTPHFLKRAKRLAAKFARNGLAPISEERLLRAYASHARTMEERREAKSPYLGCQSVTAVARNIGMPARALFAALEEQGWLYRSDDRWQATDEALDGEWAVQRGRYPYSWPQITPKGQEELDRLFGERTN